MSYLSNKLNRVMHDGYTALRSKLGRKARGVQNPDRTRAINLDIYHAPTESVNDLERKFYGSYDPVIPLRSEHSMHEIQDVWVTGANGHLFLDKNEFLHICRSFDGIEDKKIRRPIPWLAKTVSDPVFVLMGRGLGNRGHFLVEHLPRYMACRDQLPANTKIMIPPGQRSWSEAYLAKLGVCPDQIIEASHGTILLKSAFYIPLFSPDERARLAPKPFYEELRNAFVTRTPSAARKQLFITRKDAPSRLMVNEDEIFEAARARFPKLEKISMPSLSLDEQVAAFANAELVIGAHNQAFRNLLFCTDALCVQLVNGQRDENNVFYFWANNYSLLGAMFGNDCVALYSETSLDPSGNWLYPSEKFITDLERIIELRA